MRVVPEPSGLVTVEYFLDFIGMRLGHVERAGCFTAEKVGRSGHAPPFRGVTGAEMLSGVVGVMDRLQRQRASRRGEKIVFAMLKRKLAAAEKTLDEIDRAPFGSITGDPGASPVEPVVEAGNSEAVHSGDGDSLDASLDFKAFTRQTLRHDPKLRGKARIAQSNDISVFLCLGVVFLQYFRLLAKASLKRPGERICRALERISLEFRQALPFWASEIALLLEASDNGEIELAILHQTQCLMPRCRKALYRHKSAAAFSGAILHIQIRAVRQQRTRRAHNRHNRLHLHTSFIIDL